MTATNTDQLATIIDLLERAVDTLDYLASPADDADDAAIELTTASVGILAARAEWPDANLAWLYDPDTMPANLKAAHKHLDEIVDKLYDPSGFGSDAERLEMLLERYSEAVSDD